MKLSIGHNSRAIAWRSSGNKTKRDPGLIFESPPLLPPSFGCFRPPPRPGRLPSLSTASLMRMGLDGEIVLPFITLWMPLKKAPTKLQSWMPSRTIAAAMPFSSSPRFFSEFPSAVSFFDVSFEPAWSAPLDGMISSCY